MASEEEIAGVYEDYLGQQTDMELISSLSKAIQVVNNEPNTPVVAKLEDYERTQLISIIQNIDWTGEYDMGFEDLRKSVSTNDSCG